MSNYILTNENAIYYECNYSCDNVIFIKLGNESFFITDARYTIEAKEKVKKAEVIESSDLIKSAKELLKKEKIKEIIFDGNDFTYNKFNSLCEGLKINFTNQVSFSHLKRVIKTDKEIAILKKAANIGRDGFERLAKYINKSGLNKKETLLHFKAIEAYKNKGNYDLSFDPIIAINENAAKPHALPTVKKLQKDDLLLVDAGVKYKRYCSDRTCTASFSKELSFSRKQKFKSKKQQKIYDLVYKAQVNAIENAKVGMKAKEIDNLTRSIIEKAGYGKYFIHSTGHGVGLDIHEHPYINSKSDVIIEDNMVFTIEPGIYLPNEFGVRIEDTVVMKNGKVEIL